MGGRVDVLHHRHPIHPALAGRPVQHQHAAGGRSRADQRARLGPTETMHFQTWSDKAGNAPPLTDPTNGLTFPNLNAPPFGGETFQTNLIMPEPCPFLSRKLPKCSIIRPTETKGIAMNVVKFLTAMGLFIGQPPQFFQLLQELAHEADQGEREV